MGADLIVSVLAHPSSEGFKLNWAAGDEVIDATVTLPELEAWATELDECGRLEDCMVEGGDEEEVDYAKVKDEVKNIFLKLKEEVVDGDGYPPRDVACIKVRGLWLVLSGGMSWGDLPTEACEYIDAAQYFPEVLEAIGFVLNWDEEA